MTSNGAGAPFDPFCPTEARLACRLGGSVRVTTAADGQERLTEIHDGDTALWRYFHFAAESDALELAVVAEAGAKVSVRDGKGAIYGEGTVPAGDGKTLTCLTIRLTRPFAKGRAAVELSVAGEKGRSLFQLESLTFKNVTALAETGP